MDAYPVDYIAHNLPLIFLCGLGSSDLEPESLSYPLLAENGYPLNLDLPLVETPAAENLLKILLEVDGSDGPWNSRNDVGRAGGVGFKMKTVGRSFILPPRKANRPPTSPPLSPDLKSSRSSPPPLSVLHSPISPLTPSSPIFPDAVMTPLWVSKHERLLPSALILFCPLTSDRDLSTLRDNQLKTEINAFRNALEATKYRMRLVIVLMSDGSESDGDSEERIAGIRRATNMDSKNSFFSLPAEPLQVELREFVKSLLSTLQPSCVEYYRDLSKHARKKRNRGAVPPPTAPPTSGTSQVLSVQGWNVRYEFKLGVLAEFRQEMDAACRNYESAYEGLLGQDLFESIAGWSPRFNETRLLADTIAIRIMRCLLWNGQTTTAVRWWSNHRTKMHDLVDRKGKGTNNYGWEAWEARWSQVMAETIIRVNPASLTVLESPDMHTRRAGAVYAFPEKAFPIGERLPPWDMLHHPGCWYHRAAKHTMIRLAWAEQMPEEDRASPGQSPASHIANKSYLYDTYLAPEPHVEFPLPGRTGFNHLDLIIENLKKAIKEFADRNQIRQSIHLRLELARQLMSNGAFDEAHDYLWPIWKKLPWRQAGWWDLLQEFDLVLRECAVRTQEHAESVIQVDWELMSRVFPAQPSTVYDLSLSLKGMNIGSPKPAVVLKYGEAVSCVTASFGFHKFEGNVGEPLQSQLIITSNARPLSTPIVLSEVKIVFEGGLRPVWLMDNSDPSVAQSSQTKIEDVALRDSVHSTDLSYPASPTGGIVSLVGKCDLTLAPGQSRVYNFTSVPRESGDVRLDSITLLLEQETFSLAYVVPGHEHEGGVWIKQSTTGPKLRQFGFDRNVTAAKIHPKPPKIRIETPTLNDTYYTDERVELDIDIINNEDEAADVEVEARLLGGAENSSSISWTDLSWAGLEDPHADILAKEPTQGGTSYLEKRPIGLLSKQDTTKLKLLISNTSNPFDYELEITATYHLLSDPETPIIKISTVDVTFIRPFEGHCDFLPRLHPDRWPNFFHVNGDVDPESGKPSPSGIPQRYSLATKLIPLAQESLVVTDVYPSVATTHGDVTCTVHPTPTPFAPAVLPPDHFGEFDFTLDVRKQHLEDRRHSTLTLALQIHWHRPSTPSQTIKTHLPIPRFLVPHEPRVLATAAHLPPATKPLPLHPLPPPIHLTYTLENPSMHTLPFALDMSASEDFAFSGPKARTLHLLPYTRQVVNYVLLSAKSGVWIRPSLEVMDTYFSTKVRVFPGGKGVKRGRGGDRDGEEGGRGIMVWVGDGSSDGKDGSGPGDGVEGQSWVVGRKV